jgi:hypothetical protein
MKVTLDPASPIIKHGETETVNERRKVMWFIVLIVLAIFLPPLAARGICSTPTPASLFLVYERVHGLLDPSLREQPSHGRRESV